MKGEWEIELTEEMGGDAGAEVKRIRNKGIIPCHGICFKETHTKDIRGYPHDGGIADRDGNKWWVYVHCNNPVMRADIGMCDYDTSWGKIR